MGEIRSALEIALEKTEGIKGDKQAIQNEKIKNAGKKAAAVFLGGGSAEDLAAAVAAVDAASRQKFAEGALPIFCAGVKLPEDEEGVSALGHLAEGFKEVFPHAGLDALFRQAGAIFKQYLEDEAALYSALERQFAPRLKAKAEALSKQYGQPISLSLDQDAEYSAALSRGLKALQDQYDAVINEIRGRMKEAARLQSEE